MTHPDEPAPAVEPEESDETTPTVPAQPGEAQPGEAQPGEAQPGEAQPGDAPGRSGPRPLVWVVSGVLVVVLVAGIVWAAVATSRWNRENAIRQTATDYLTALAEADAGAALGTLAERPENTALLTDEVLAASQEAAPLTEIEIGALAGEESNATVDVTYRLGSQPVETTLALVDAGAGWRIADGTVDLVVPERRALTVNGATLTEEVNPVLPGSYTAAATSDKVALSGEATALIASPDHEGARIEVTVGLSELGTQTTLDAVRARLDECLASTQSRPVDCPFGLSTEGVEVAPDSVRFTLVNDPWAGFAPTLDPDTLVASGTVTLQLNATATVTRDGLSTEATLGVSVDRGYAVDLTQDPAVVTWS